MGSSLFKGFVETVRPVVNEGEHSKHEHYESEEEKNPEGEESRAKGPTAMAMAVEN